jgi:hypothetical protein
MMSRRAPRDLPNWPAAMETELAASYVGLGETSFRGWAARNGVMPIDLGVAVIRWRKRDLDAAIEASPLKPGEGSTIDLEAAQAAALARVAKRARRT